MDNTILWALISIQVAMGAFDTLVHHEGSERLAWRPSQKNELRLHGVRNFFYAIIFLCFAWLEPHGAYTIILVAILVVEVLITLWDFVEEDMTRKLPGTERINHTLLALNYGAILAFAAPIFWQWAQLPTAVRPTHYGWWSVMATVSAIGVGLFSVRDLAAAARSSRLRQSDPASLVSVMPARQNVLVTGGTGFIGEHLVHALVAAGHAVTVLTRDFRRIDQLAHPVRVIDHLDLIHDCDRIDVVVNLAGEPVANSIWTKRKRTRIIDSRVDMTRAVDHLIARLNHPPKCLINGSAVGFYGPQSDDAPRDETAAGQPAFVHDVCATWEAEAQNIARRGVRVVMLRIGVVLGVEGGILAKLLTPFEFGGGGVMGTGQQWMSWISRDDMIRVIAHAIAHPDLDGPVNAVAPHPVTNSEFSQELATALHRPLWLRFPAAALSAVLGDMAKETMLTGQRVVPAKLLQSEFEFLDPEVGPLLRQITGAVVAQTPAERKKGIQTV